jgi:hypothetical protein
LHNLCMGATAISNSVIMSSLCFFFYLKQYLIFFVVYFLKAPYNVKIVGQ